MIKFILRIKNAPPEAIEWYSSTGYETPTTYSVPPVGGFRNIALNAKYQYEWEETWTTWPTFIYVRTYDSNGMELPPPHPERQYWDIQSGDFTYDWATGEVVKTPFPVAWLIAGGIALTALFALVRRR